MWSSDVCHHKNLNFSKTEDSERTWLNWNGTYVQKPMCLMAGGRGLFYLFIFWRASVWHLIYLFESKKGCFWCFFALKSLKHIVICTKHVYPLQANRWLFWVAFNFTLCCSWCLRMRTCLLPVYVGIGLVWNLTGYTHFEIMNKKYKSVFSFFFLDVVPLYYVQCFSLPTTILSEQTNCGSPTTI